MPLNIPDPPKVDSYGCYDIKEVLNYVKFVGEDRAAVTLNVARHRIIFFVQKHKEKAKRNVHSSVQAVR